MGTWVEWHEGYERPGSSLTRRLGVVQSYLRTAVDSAGPAATILSLCSGDGRDVIGVLGEQSGWRGRAVLVELDEHLADRARSAAAAAALTKLEVRNADAGVVASFGDVLPVDVVLLCGIFGNVTHESVKFVVDCSSQMVKPGGFVVWTRGGSEPDRRPEVRASFHEAGFDEIAFEGFPEPYGVGLNRLTVAKAEPGPLPLTLFRFEAPGP